MTWSASPPVRPSRPTQRQNSRLTSQNQVGFAFPTTNTVVEPTMRPAKDSPKAAKKRHVGPSFVYGRNQESFGGSVVQKVAMVVRSKPPCKDREGFSHVKTEVTYDNVRVLDAFPQRVSSLCPNSIMRHVTSLPCRTEAPHSKSHESKSAMES
jgi:hypothetical protein